MSATANTKTSDQLEQYESSPASETTVSEKVDAAEIKHPEPLFHMFDNMVGMAFNGSNVWWQGVMQIDQPNKIVWEAMQRMMSWMLFIDDPRHIVQLGLGAAVLTKFCYHHFPNTRVTAIELNPSVIYGCRKVFGLPPDDERLSVRVMDAMDFVMDDANAGTVDILQVDLYDEVGEGPALATPEFYAACARCLTPQGIMTVNLCGPQLMQIKEDNEKAMQVSFEKVICLPQTEANFIAIAFKNAVPIDLAMLREKAVRIAASTNLPTAPWIDGLMGA